MQLTLLEACEYLNKIIPYTRYSNGKVNIDKYHPLFIDTLSLKELCNSGELKYTKKGNSYLINITDLEILQEKRLIQLKEINEEIRKRNIIKLLLLAPFGIIALILFIMILTH